MITFFVFFDTVCWEGRRCQNCQGLGEASALSPAVVLILTTFPMCAIFVRRKNKLPLKPKRSFTSNANKAGIAGATEIRIN